jgi:ribosomal protein S1
VITRSAADEGVVFGGLSRHHRGVSGSDSEEWRALRERRKPTDPEWAVAKSRFTKGVVATGLVLSHHPFGFFVDLDDTVTGLVEMPRVKELGQPVDTRDYPPVGQEITAVVLGAVDLQRQVHLSIRPSDLKAAN